LLVEQNDRLRKLLFDDKDRMEIITARVDELRRRATETTSEIATKLEALAQVGRENELRDVKGVAYPQLKQELLGVKAGQELGRGPNGEAAGLLPQLKEIADLLQKNDRWTAEFDQARQRVGLVLSSLEQQGQSSLKAAEIRISEAAARLRQAEAEAKVEAVGLLKNEAQRRRQALQTAISGTETTLLDLQKQMLEVTDQAKIDDLNQQLRHEIDKELEARKKAIMDAITTVRGRIDTAERFLNDFKGTAERVDQVMAAAKAAIVAAGSIPNGIIAGTASGTFTSMGDSLIEAAKAGVEVIRHAETVIQNVEDAKSRIDSLKSSLNQYEAKLQSVTADQVTAEIEKSIARVRSQAASAAHQLEARIAERKRDSQQKVTDITRIDDEILGVERQQMEHLVTQAKSKVDEFAAAVKLAEYSREREQDKAKSLSLDLATLMTRMRDLYGEINALLQTRLQAVTEARTSRANSERVQLDRTESLSGREHAILDRIAKLQKQIRLAKANQATVPGIATAVELLQAEAIGPSAAMQTRELREQLDVANKLLFEYANWLYMLSGDREALRWAIWSDNVSDARTVWLKLTAIDQRQVNERLEHGAVKYFGVRMTRDELLERGAADPNGGVALFTVAAAFPRQRTVSEDFGLPTNEKISIHLPMEDWPQLLFAPGFGDALESARLLDVFIIPTWRKGVNAFTEDRINIEAVGPTVVVVNGELTEFRIQKVYEDATGKVIPYRATPHASTQTRAAVAARHNVLSTESPTHESRFERPDANFVLVAGRGLGNTWRLTFPAGGDQSKQGAPGLKDLESLTIVFSYVVSGLGTDAVGYKPNAEPHAIPPPMIGPVIPADDLFRGQLAEYQRSTTRLGFSTGPAGLLGRIQILRRSSELLASYDQLSSESLSPETPADNFPLPLSEELRRFAANTNLISVLSRYQEATNQPGLPAADLRLLAHEIIGKEMLRGEVDDKSDAVGAILGTINLGGLWTELSAVLGKPGAAPPASILGQIDLARLNLQAANDTLNDVAQTLGPVRSLVGRVNYDTSVYDGQQEIMTSLVEGLQNMAANKPVELELRERATRIRAYQVESGWLRQWSLGKDQTAEQLQLYRLDKALDDLRFTWRAYLQSPQATDSSSKQSR
jgi:hypothetical protein